MERPVSRGTMRRRSVEPAGSSQEDLRRGLPSPTPTVAASLAGPRLTHNPSRSTVEPETEAIWAMSGRWPRPARRRQWRSAGRRPCRKCGWFPRSRNRRTGACKMPGEGRHVELTTSTEGRPQAHRGGGTSINLLIGLQPGDDDLGRFRSQPAIRPDRTPRSSVFFDQLRQCRRSPGVHPADISKGGRPRCRPRVGR